MKEITEDQLWDYAEGRLPAPEKPAVEQWLAGDPGRRRQLEDIRLISGALSGGEAEQPSLRFAARVMEAWDTEQALRTAPLKTHTDKRVVYAVGGLLVLTLAFFLGTLFTSSHPGLLRPEEQVNRITRMLETIFRPALAQYFTGAVALLLLLMGERYMHYRRFIRNI